MTYLDGSQDELYFQSIRRHAVAFATVFNNINLVRFAADGVTPVSKQKVPLVYGPKSHWYQKIIEKSTTTSDLGRNVEFQTVLPRLSFYMPHIEYVPARQLNPINIVTRKIPTAGATASTPEYFQLVPVAYDLHFRLSIYSKTTDDGLNVLEQILPMFSPTLNVRIREIDQMEQYRNVPIKLTDVNQTDNYEEGYTTNRIITWDLDFIVQAAIYPPLDASKLILQTIVDFKNDYLNPPADLETITVTALGVNPLDYNKANSSVEITDP